MRAKLARNSSVVILIQRPMIKRNLTGIVEDSGKPAIPADSLSLDTLQWAFGNPRVDLSVLASMQGKCLSQLIDHESSNITDT
ncbi:MAG TPA: hypothetical protein VLL06_06480 [Nitrospiraceae bacterium]|nr:hypothetical protein [Nitrospiraceae bacterium]